MFCSNMAEAGHQAPRKELCIPENRLWALPRMQVESSTGRLRLSSDLALLCSWGERHHQTAKQMFSALWSES